MFEENCALLESLSECCFLLHGSRLPLLGISVQSLNRIHPESVPPSLWVGLGRNFDPSESVQLERRSDTASKSRTWQDNGERLDNDA